MPEAITYYVSHAGNFAEFGESITLAGEGTLSPSLTITKGDAPRALTYLSKAVWQAYRAGAISITPNPDNIGFDGDISSPLHGNRASSDVITSDYTVTKDDCGKVKELSQDYISITLPNAVDFISGANGKFYVTFLARNDSCVFYPGDGAIIENTNTAIVKNSAVTAFLHVKGDGDMTEAVWGIYGGLIEAMT